MEDEILEFTYKTPQKKRAWVDNWVEPNLIVESTTVAASDRKLKATWSYEAAQDLRSQHSISSQHLCDILAQELAAEIDRDIIGDLRSCLD